MPTADGLADLQSLTTLGNRQGFTVTENTSSGEPAHNYSRVSYDGHTINVRTRDMLNTARTRAINLGVPLGSVWDITQGSYTSGNSSSAGTHDGGGVVDISVSNMTTTQRSEHAIRALREAGFAAWLRTPDEGFSYHIHAVAIGDREQSPSAHDQQDDYFAGRNGLANNGPDSAPSSVGRPYPAWAEQYNTGTAPPPPTGDTVELSNVQYGLSNSDVERVQDALISEGFSIPAGSTGYFGDQTKSAYSQFQQSMGFSGSDADGNPGCTSLTELGRRQGFPVACSTGSEGGTSGGRAAAPIKSGYSYYISLQYGVAGNYAAGYHTGRDYAASSGTPLVAVLDGTIGQKGYDAGGYGYYVVLQAVDGRDYWYCHMNASSFLSTGTSVNANQTIGYVGSTGNSTGPHCHFEDRPRGGGYGNVRNPSW